MIEELMAQWLEWLEQTDLEEYLESLLGQEVTYIGKGQGGPSAWRGKVVGWGRLVLWGGGVRAYQFQLITDDGQAHAIERMRQLVAEGEPEPLVEEGLVAENREPGDSREVS